MSGVWVFKTNGVMRLMENPGETTTTTGSKDSGQSSNTTSSSAATTTSGSRRKVLVHLPSGQVVTSYSSLEHILMGLGWERYHDGDPDLLQYHKQTSIDLISLPRDFQKFNSIYMYDIVVKNPNLFHVRDIH